MGTSIKLKSRHYEDRDLVAVCDLLNLCAAIDNLDDYYTVEQLKQRFGMPSLDRFNDQRIWDDANARLVGFAQVWSLPSDHTLDCYFYFRVHPAMRGTGIEEELIDWAVQRTQEVGRQHDLKAVLMGRIFEHESYSRGIFERHGFEIVRYGFRMARPLSEPIPEPTFPEGYKLRHAEGEDDIQPWVDCYNQSFIDHWLFHPETVDERRHRLQRPGYRPEQDLVAVAPDGSFAAFCLWYLDEVGNALQGKSDGWIGLLGTRRGHRGVGLGRAMLLAGLRCLKDEGADIAKLGVDAENPTGALGLYEKVGFVKVATRISYHKDV
ncbi:MAG TPA: GNAT family N-acetyltransferase [Chloroflexia bacterium]|nr:GNAT family N-acetyltransferase [Chloroflexia bacterium]